jgi:hypothetical protein
MSLPSIGIENLNCEADRAVVSGQRVHDLPYWSSGPGREVNVLGRAIHESMSFYRVSADDR